MASKLANILQGKLFDKALDSIKFNKISTNTFDFKFQSKILDELQTGLNKLDINTIKTKVNDTLTSSFNSRITPDNPRTYKDAYLDDIANNPSKYFTANDLDSIIREIPPGGNLRSFVIDNFNFRLDNTNLQKISDELKSQDFIELDLDVRTAGDDLRLKAQQEGGIGKSTSDPTPENLIDEYKSSRLNRDPGDTTKNKVQKEQDAKNDALDVTKNKGNNRIKIGNSVILVSALAGWALYKYMRRKDQEGNITKIEKFDDETLLISYDSDIEFCKGDKPKITIFNDDENRSVIDSTNTPRRIEASFDILEKISDKSIKFKPGFKIKSVPSVTATSEDPYGVIENGTTFFNQFTCVILGIVKGVAAAAKGAADELGITDFLKGIMNFFKKSGLIILGVIVGIIILYMALKFFVFRGGDNTEIKLISPSTARYYYR